VTGPHDPKQQARRQAEACIRCGACMTVCPVYRAGRREELSTRGKLAIIRAMEKGDLRADRELVRSLGSCLLCGRCTSSCPSSVQGAEGIQAARAALATEVGAPLFKRLVLQFILPEPGRMDLAVQAGRVALKGVPASSGLNLRLSRLEKLHKIPQPSNQPFLGGAPLEVPGPKGAESVGLFVGCVGNYLRPALMEKAVRLLSERFTVLIPQDQGCCGLPAVGAGLDGAAEKLARRNLSLFASLGADHIVTTCSSCLHAMVHDWPRLHEATWVKRLVSTAVEISQVLAGEPEQLKDRALSKELVAVHDPCHLSSGMGITSEPRRMLQVAGVNLVEMEGPDQCCGGGGLFSLNEPELSREIFAPREEAFLKSGARVLATSCSGCWLQWLQGLREGVNVVHPVELIR
jgi:glycolate oxidase iron-sulfur subunit